MYNNIVHLLGDTITQIMEREILNEMNLFFKTNPLFLIVLLLKDFILFIYEAIIKIYIS